LFNIFAYDTDIDKNKKKCMPKGKEEMTLEELVREELIRYIPFPDALKGKYQSFTQADIGKLREAGYQEEFLDVKEGVGNYVKWMLENFFKKGLKKKKGFVNFFQGAFPYDLLHCYYPINLPIKE